MDKVIPVMAKWPRNNRNNIGADIAWPPKIATLREDGLVSLSKDRFDAIKQVRVLLGGLFQLTLEVRDLDLQFMDLFVKEEVLFLESEDTVML
ncbi:hypothetical protein C0431_13045 [bacterium]|nr:hypothetical protein [bacterium]